GREGRGPDRHAGSDRTRAAALTPAGDREPPRQTRKSRAHRVALGALETACRPRLGATSELTRSLLCPLPSCSPTARTQHIPRARPEASTAAVGRSHGRWSGRVLDGLGPRSMVWPCARSGRALDGLAAPGLAVQSMVRPRSRWSGPAVDGL